MTATWKSFPGFGSYLAYKINSDWVQILTGVFYYQKNVNKY